uniref:Uncharacterized protein LOC101503108 isoform X2 n=1 Tax=Rhizophora mucronata TaxID=61149 RepID=A0A2P2MQJ4_RHIMU
MARKWKVSLQGVHSMNELQGIQRFTNIKVEKVSTSKRNLKCSHIDTHFHIYYIFLTFLVAISCLRILLKKRKCMSHRALDKGTDGRCTVQWIQ